MHCIHMTNIVSIHSKSLSTELTCKILLPPFPRCVLATLLSTSLRNVFGEGQILHKQARDHWKYTGNRLDTLPTVIFILHLKTGQQLAHKSNYNSYSSPLILKCLTFNTKVLRMDTTVYKMLKTCTSFHVFEVCVGEETVSCTFDTETVFYLDAQH